MKKSLLFCVFVLFVSGCQEEVVTFKQLNLGMQLYEIEELSYKPLVPMSSEIAEGHTVVKYRAWFYDGVNRGGGLFALPNGRKQPYQLTFQRLTPLTKEQRLEHISEKGYTDPNTIKAILVMEGTQPSRLVKIELDTNYLARQAAAEAVSQQQRRQQQQQQQIMDQLQYMEHKASFDRMTRGGLP